MSRQYFTEYLAWVTADATAIANSVTETIIFPDVAISSNYMADGRKLLVDAWGKLSTTSTPTIRFKLRWGGVSGTVLWDSGTMTNASAVTNAIWHVELNVQTRANGSSGSLLVFGTATINGAAAPTVGSATGAPGIALASSAGVSAPAAVTVDLTPASTNLSITALWGTQSASNTLTGMSYDVVAPN